MRLPRFSRINANTGRRMLQRARARAVTASVVPTALRLSELCRHATVDPTAPGSFNSSRFGGVGAFGDIDERLDKGLGRRPRSTMTLHPAEESNAARYASRDKRSRQRSIRRARCADSARFISVRNLKKTLAYKRTSRAREIYYEFSNFLYRRLQRD